MLLAGLADVLDRQNLYPSGRTLMTSDAPGKSLLEELDARQDDLLIELDQLNARIEHVLREVLIWRSAQESACEPA